MGQPNVRREEESVDQISSFDNSRRTELIEDKTTTQNQEQAGQQTIEELITMHSNESQLKKRNSLFSSANWQLGCEDKDKTIIYSTMDVECEHGLKIALDDDFTNDYEAYVLGIEANEFSMKSVYLTSDVLNKFRSNH